MTCVSVPDVNECADPNACPGEQCENRPGSYECVRCRPGHEARGGTCYGEDGPPYYPRISVRFLYVCDR